MWNPFRTKKKICLIKKQKTSVNGWETTYFTEIDGVYVSGSIFNNWEQAENFYNRVVSLKGETESKDILKSKKV